MVNKISALTFYSQCQFDPYILVAINLAPVIFKFEPHDKEAIVCKSYIKIKNYDRWLKQLK